MTTKTVAAIEAKSSVKPEVRDFAKRVKEIFTIDKKTGETVVTADSYVTLAPAHLTKEILTDVQAYNNLFLAGGALAFGEEAIPVMKKNDGVDQVTLKVPMIGKDYMGFAFDRSRQVPSRDADNNPNGTKTKFGSMSVEIVSYGAKTRGQLSQVKSELGELAMAAFGKSK